MTLSDQTLVIELDTMFYKLSILRYTEPSPRVKQVYNLGYLDVLSLKHLFIIAEDIAGTRITLTQQQVNTLLDIQQELRLKLSLGMSFQREAEMYSTQISDTTCIPSLTSRVMILDIQSKTDELIQQCIFCINSLFASISSISSNKELVFTPETLEQENFNLGTKWFFNLLDIYKAVQTSTGPVAILTMFTIIRDNLNNFSESTKQELFDITETKLGGTSLENVSLCLQDWIIRNNLQQCVKDLLIV